MLSRNAVVALTLGALFARGAVAQSAPPGPAWRESPVHARLFTPRHVPDGTYRAYVTDLGLDAALKRLEEHPALSAWPDAWRVESLAPLDAFGLGGSYNRWAVTQLYRGTPARAARGPRMDAGQPVEAWTLISPFPDETLEHLRTGTLLIVLRLR